MDTLAIARRSLGHFAVGRILSGIVGFGCLLLLVRALERTEYGFYLALFAAFEIIQLIATPGVFAVVFRYLPEVQVTGARRTLVTLILASVIYRVITLVLVGVLLATSSDFLAAQLGVESLGVAVRYFAVYVVFEGSARLVDAQFEALLKQGYAQVSLLIRYGTRFIVLLVLSRFGTEVVPLVDWLQMELMTSGFGLVVAWLLMWRCVSRVNSSQNPEERAIRFSRLLRFALPTYISQVLYVMSGPQMVQILMVKLLGPTAMAPFGFAANLGAMMQRYLPGFLLVGWIRPLIIAVREQGGSNERIVMITNLVSKINFLVIMPIGSLLLVAGESVVSILTGGKLPETLTYLYFFVVLLVLQAMRAVTSLVGMAFELGGASLRATVLSTAGLIVGLVLYPSLGLPSLCLGLALMEVFWCAVMVHELRKVGLILSVPWMAYAQMLFCALAASAVCWTLVSSVPQDAGDVLFVAAGVASSVITLAMIAVFRPFDREEQTMLTRLVPIKHLRRSH